MALHRNLSGLDIHPVVTFTYADAAERTAATGFTANDVNKLAIQQNDNSLWLLVDFSPITWQSIGGVDTFLNLTDTPVSYSGEGLKGLRVNAGETALEYVDLSATFTALTDTPANYTGADNQVPVVDESGSQLVFGLIVNDNISASAAIDWDKIVKGSHTELLDIGTNTHPQIDTHIASTANPHSTTLEQARTSGSTLSGDFSMGSNTITNHATPVNAGDVANKSYVDSVASGLNWIEPVINEVDFTTAEPGSPNVGDRYINTVTGSSSGTAQSVTATYIYEWNGASWTETIPSSGDAVLVTTTGDQKTYDGAQWLLIQQGVTHNSLLGLQGGTTNEYFHLTNTEYGNVQTDVPLNTTHRGLTNNPHTTTLELARTAGNTLSGEIDMGANKIVDVADPTLAQDAATKNYVDSNLPSSTVTETIVLGAFNANYGNYRTRSVGSSAAFRFTFFIPKDVVSITAIRLVGIPTGSNATADIDFFSDYGAVGEDYQFNQESNTTSTYNIPTANQIVAFDITSVFSSAAAGDFCGILVDHMGLGLTMHYICMEIEYTR